MTDMYIYLHHKAVSWRQSLIKGVWIL